MTEEQIQQLAEFYSGRFDDPTDGCVLSEKAKKASLKNARKSLRKWIEVLNMNGLTITGNIKPYWLKD